MSTFAAFAILSGLLNILLALWLLTTLKRIKALMEYIDSDIGSSPPRQADEDPELFI